MQYKAFIFPYSLQAIGKRLEENNYSLQTLQVSNGEVSNHQGTNNKRSLDG